MDIIPTFLRINQYPIFTAVKKTLKFLTAVLIAWLQAKFMP
ncbi:MAG: hypothetical protein Q4A81_03290 [Pasteurellaceae bacterium]|nr:hypothetical protein [Pasteurellaceae bacterium]